MLADSVDFDITYMAARIFSKNLDLNKNAYSRTASRVCLKIGGFLPKPNLL